MKVLVTGDRGYIGSVLVPKLLKKKIDVIGIDANFFARKTSGLKYKEIKKDVRNIHEEDLKGIDAIVHLSALSNDPLGSIDPSLTVDINYKATVRLAKIAKKSGVKKFIFSSSCSIYGIAKNGVVDEKSKVNPLTEYARSKIKSEKALKKMADDKFFVALLRNSTVYGYSPSFRNDLVVNNLVTCALATSEIRILSDGTPWRPLIDVRDLSDIIIEFLMKNKPSLNGIPVNIGFDENNLQIKDIVSAVKKSLPKCKIIFTGEHGKDSRSYRVSFGLFRKNFSYVYQKWPVEKSVKNLIKELKKRRYGKKDFISGKETRLAVLRELLENGKINKKMFWTDEN